MATGTDGGHRTRARPADPPPVVLRDDELARLGRDGFVAVDRPVVGEPDVAEVRALLDGLFVRFDRLPPELAYDLGDVQHHDGPPEIPEINLPSRLEPRLLESVAFDRCRALARQVLGPRAEPVHDHAICKPARSTAAIDWHQDLAFAPWVGNRPQVHVWLALQDTTEANGCVRFIPRAGEPVLLPHRRRAGPESHALVATGVDASTAVACPLAAGMVTIHQPATLHSSGPNTTDERRVAWILHFQDPGPRWSPTRIRRWLGRLRRSRLG